MCDQREKLKEKVINDMTMTFDEKFLTLEYIDNASDEELNIITIDTIVDKILK